MQHKPAARRNDWLAPTLVIAGAALLRAAYLFAYSRDLPFLVHPFGDAEIYLDWARAIASGDTGHAAFYRAPLYPYFLSLLMKAGASSLVACIAQQILGLGTLLLIWLTARRLFSRRAAILSLGLAALSAPPVFFETKLLSATPIIFLVSLGTYLIVGAGEKRSRWPWLVAGAVFGVAALAWAGALIIFAVICAWALVGRVAGRKAVPLGIAACLAAVSVVTVRNAVVGNDFVPISANAGFTFYQGNNRLAAGTLALPPEVYEFRHEGRLLTSIADQEQFERLYAESRAGRSLRPSQVSSFWFGRALSWIARNPVPYAALLGRKAVLALSDYESPSDFNLELETSIVPPLRLAIVRFGILLALAVAGLFLARPRAGWPLYAAASGTLLALLAFYVADRYRLPMYPALAILAGAGASEVWRKARDRKLTAAPVIAGIATLLLSVVAFNLPLRRGSDLLLAGAFRNLAEVRQYRSAEPARAEPAYLKSIALYEARVNRASLQERVELAQTRALLAELYLQTGRRVLAARQVELARALDAGVALPSIATDPLVAARAALGRAATTSALALAADAVAADSSNRDAWLTLGALYGARGRDAEALALFDRALAQFPEDPVILFNSAVAALKTGQYRAALARAEEVLRRVPDHPSARRIADEARRRLGR
jgi:4-amino-4-deoxy-L-arabinose transferase-like glycosyltransferase